MHLTDTTREEIARAISPEAWADDLPIPTREHTIAFHTGRMKSIAAVTAIEPIINRLIAETLAKWLGVDVTALTSD